MPSQWSTRTWVSSCETWDTRTRSHLRGVTEDTRSDLRRRQQRRVIEDANEDCQSAPDAIHWRGEGHQTINSKECEHLCVRWVSAVQVVRASMVTVRSWMKNRRQGSDPQCLSPAKGHGHRRGKWLRQSLRLPRHCQWPNDVFEVTNRSHIKKKWRSVRSKRVRWRKPQSSQRRCRQQRTRLVVSWGQCVQGWPRGNCECEVRWRHFQEGDGVQECEHR